MYLKGHHEFLLANCQLEFGQNFAAGHPPIFCTEGDGCGKTLSKYKMIPDHRLPKSLSIILYEEGLLAIHNVHRRVRQGLYREWQK
jgi:hypothetical protein